MTIDPGLWLLLSGPSTPPDPSTIAPYRDADIYDDIIARLNATGEFTYVDSFEAGGPESSADATWLATVVPGDAEDIDLFDPIVIDRHGVGTITISVIETDPRTRWRKLEELANVARNALNGKSLADLTFPALTMVRHHSTGKPMSPGQPIVLDIEYTYQLEGFDSYNTADLG